MNEPPDVIAWQLTTKAVPDSPRDTTMKLINQLDDWLNGRISAPLPMAEILQAFHDYGKQFVDKALLQRLDGVRQRLAASQLLANTWIGAALATLLDKYDDKYDYYSYLALDLLNWEENATGNEALLDWRLTLLTFDIMRFEFAALSGNENWLPRIPSDEKLASMRGRRLLRAMQAALERQQLTPHNVESGVITEISNLWSQIDARMSETDRLRLNYSLLPVDKVHDEYLFLRILQTFETVFSWLAVSLNQVIRLGTTDIHQSHHLIERCHQRLCEASLLFPLLSSLRVEAFRDFRTHTEGASAIQSHSYKTVESLCRTPSKERINSIAYISVPEVRNRVLQQSETIDSVYLNMGQTASISPSDLAVFSQAMNAFEFELKKWRQSHYGIAVKMLGVSPGTGYTEGTPYLNEVRHIAVFEANKIQEIK